MQITALTRNISAMGLPWPSLRISVSAAIIAFIDVAKSHNGLIDLQAKLFKLGQLGFQLQRVGAALFRCGELLGSVETLVGFRQCGSDVFDFETAASCFGVD
jgi:hypothetical protein